MGPDGNAVFFKRSRSSPIKSQIFSTNNLWRLESFTIVISIVIIVITIKTQLIRFELVKSYHRVLNADNEGEILISDDLGHNYGLPQLWWCWWPKLWWCWRKIRWQCWPYHNLPFVTRRPFPGGTPSSGTVLICQLEHRWHHTPCYQNDVDDVDDDNNDGDDDNHCDM